MVSVLVTDGEQRSALAIVRSLAAAGYQPFVTATRRRSLAGKSRYARGTAVVPNPLKAPLQYVTALHRLVSDWKIDVMLPVTDESLFAILAQRDTFERVCIPYPPLDRVTAIANKAEVLERARRLGIAVPAQLMLENANERDCVDRAALRFPIVLKPARSLGESDGQRAKVGVSYAQNLEQLDTLLTQLPPQAYPLLLQERIVGPGVGIFMLVWEGEAVAVFSHRRIREKPPSGGVSVYRESIPADPRLVESSRALLAEFGWQGVAMIEYKLDSVTQTPYLMEINGRFWGSLQLAVDAGVDFPALLVAAARGARPIPVTSYRTGVRSRWWWGEVDHLLALFRHPRAASGLPGEQPNRWAAIRDFMRVFRPGDRSEVFRLNDPWPFVVESVNWILRR